MDPPELAALSQSTARDIIGRLDHSTGPSHCRECACPFVYELERDKHSCSDPECVYSIGIGMGMEFSLARAEMK